MRSMLWLDVWGFLFGFNAYFAFTERTILNTLMALFAAVCWVIEWKKDG